ncbi:MAG: TCP-1/cpn60 chaperonin family protein [Candidatus Aramenus sp.]|nr:TCP-1/cpn60 chaperonin family protein [Candidatus Aramenus sp.]
MENFLLRQGTRRETGYDVIYSNIIAVKTLAEMLKSSLGPRGLDKMLISSTQDVVVTNDGATIVKEMDVDHPAAKLVVETAKVQDSEVGDGTTSAVVFTGFLLEQAEKLLDQKVHPNTIIEGYRKAEALALSLSKEIATQVNPEDRKYLRDVAFTTLASKFFASNMDKVIDVAIEAVFSIAEKQGEEYNVDLSNVKFVKKRGESTDDVELVKGIVLDKEVPSPSMPKMVEEAKIAVIDFGLEVEKGDITAKLSITSPEQIKEALEEQARQVKAMVDAIAKTGANVVISQKGMDDIALHFLAKNKIMGIKNVSRSDLEKLAKATGAKIVSSYRDIDAQSLGYAKRVEERQVGKDKAIFVEGVKEAKAVTILIRGSTDVAMDEMERSFNDVLNSLRNVLIDPYVVAGGGAFEEELAMRLRQKTLPGKEQLALEAYANALEEMASTLAETAGLDPVNAMVDLRSLHAKGMKNAGIDVMKGRVEEDMTKINVLDSLRVKEQVIKGATDAAVAIMKIDDMIAAAPSKQPQGQEQGMPQGYPPMG